MIKFAYINNWDEILSLTKTRKMQLDNNSSRRHFKPPFFLFLMRSEFFFFFLSKIVSPKSEGARTSMSNQ